MTETFKRGSVALKDNLAVIRFPYDPERFRIVKSLPRARYKKESRQWEIPVVDFPKLASHARFSSREMNYSFSQEEFDTHFSSAAEALKEAYQDLKNNRFALSRQSIAQLPLDIVFQLNSDADSIRAFCYRKGVGKTLIENIPGSHYVRKDKNYFIPTRQFPSLLRLLRDRSIEFAVEKKLGEQLAASEVELATVGTHIPQSLARQAVLAPLIVRGESHYQLIGITAETVKSLIGWTKSAKSRQQLANSLSTKDVAKVCYFAWQSNIELFLSSDVPLETLQAEARRQFENAVVAPMTDYLVPLLDAGLCLMTDLHGRTAMLIPSSFKQEIAALRASACVTCEPRKDSSLVLIPDSKLDEAFALFERLGVAVDGLPKTKGFVKARERASSRAMAREQAEKLRRLSDIELAELEPPLAARLFPHQRIGVRWLLDNPQSFLGDDMGLGKTLTVLSAFAALKRKGMTDYLLVVCPNSLTRNWEKEVATWFPDLVCQRVPVDKAARGSFLDKLIEIPDRQLDVLVINYELARRDDVKERLLKLSRNRSAYLCLDESQRVKNPRSKSFKSLEAIAGSCRRRVLLSGTPTPKDITDIWSQMKLLDGGVRLGTNYYDWLSQVAELGTKWSDFAIKKFHKAEVEETISKVSELLLRRRKEDVVSLPEKVFTERFVEMKGDQAKRYDEVRKELLLRLTSASGDEFHKKIDSILEEYLRAVQIASNPRLVDESWEGEPAKFKELDEIVNEVVAEREEKLVIWTNYRGNITEISERYAALGAFSFFGDTEPEVRAQLVADFQSDSQKVRILVATPAAGGVGITLTSAQTAVYIDKTWNAEHWLQSVDRLHRIGQSGTVRVISLHSSRVDELIAKNLEKKSKFLGKVLGDDITEEVEPTFAELQAAVQ